MARVVENVQGYFPTGVWPRKSPSDELPIFVDPAKVHDHCRSLNERLGLSDDDVSEIIASSMKPTDEEREAIRIDEEREVAERKARDEQVKNTFENLKVALLAFAEMDSDE